MEDNNPSIAELTRLVQEAITKDEQERSYAAQQTETTSSEVAEIRQQLEAEREARARIERQLEVQVVNQTMSDVRSFADGLVESGKLPPALHDKVVTLLGVSANIEGDVKSYALEDSGAEAEKTPFALLTEVLEALPVSGQFRGGVTKDAKAAAQSGVKTKVDMRAYANDPSASDAMYHRIKEIQEGEKLSYMAAFKKVQAEINGY